MNICEKPIYALFTPKMMSQHQLYKMFEQKYEKIQTINKIVEI